MGPLRKNAKEREKLISDDSTVESIIYNLIFNYVKHMVFVMKVEEGPRFQYLFVNEMGLLYAGISEEAIGKSMEDVLPYERYLKIKKAYDRVVILNDSVTYSDQIMFPNGSMGYTESLLTPVRDEHNKIKYIVAVTRDITELVEERNRLINAEQKYRSIVDHTLDGVFTVSLEGKILEVNPSGQLLLGYAEKQMTKRSFFDLIPDAEVQKFIDLFQQTVESWRCVGVT